MEGIRERPESLLDPEEDPDGREDDESRHHHHHHRSDHHHGPDDNTKVDTPGDGSASGHPERTSSAGGIGKIFIGGLSWDTTTEKLENHFKKYGEITDAVIMRDRVSGTPRGFGFVTFADPSVCDGVLQDKHVLDGRSVECKRSIPRENISAVAKGPKTKKIFVGGIPPSITEEEFKNYFSSFGIVVEHQIMQDHNTGRSRGFGFIVFDSEQTVEDVLSHGRMHELGGKQVEIKKAEPKKAMQDTGAGYYGPASRGGYGPGPGGHYGYPDYGMPSYGGSAYRGSTYGSRYSHGGYSGGGYGGYGGGLGMGYGGGGSLGGGYMGPYGGGGHGGGGGYGPGMLGEYGDHDGYGPMSYGGGGGAYGYGSGGYVGGGGGGGGHGGGHYHSSRGHSHGSSSRYHPYSRY